VASVAKCWRQKPSNFAFAGSCTLSEYFPSSCLLSSLCFSFPSTWSHVTMQLPPSASCIGYPLHNGCVYSFIRHSSATHQTKSPTCSHRSPTYQHARRCAPPATATSLFHGRSGDSETVSSLTVAAPRVWNRLPTELKLMRSSTTTFKRHLKTFLFNSAHPSHWL